MLYFMMNDIKYIIRYQKEISYFRTKKYRDIANLIVYYYETNKTIDLASFLDFAALHEEIAENVQEIVRMVNIEECHMNAFEEFVKTIKEEEVKLDIKELKQQIASELDANKKIELANKLVELKKGV